ncbi:MAG: tetratricopeptide repeat protein [Pirellulales bacterium]|nr:tetratricopeptide repeat protein [Pirellulales bacterium]
MLTLALLVAWPPAPVAAQEDAAFLDGLRERGLFELAEAYCRDRLAQGDLPERRRAELTVEWVRTLSERAVGAAPQARGPLWRRAEAVADEFLAREPANPFRLLVAFQAAMIHLSRGEIAREEAALGVEDAGALDEAKAELRAAIREIEPLSQRINEALRGPAGRGKSLSAEELISLGNNARYQLARALAGQAQCFPAETAERVHALSRAVGLFGELARLDTVDPLAWRSRLGEASCYRLLDDPAAARAALQAIMEKQPPASVVLQAQAEGVRLALGQADRREIAAMLDLPRDRDGATSPEWDDARLEAALSLWRWAAEAKDAALAERWQTDANRMVGFIRDRGDPYWIRRAEMLLAGALRTAARSGDVEMLARAAASSYLAGQVDEALSAYDRASALAADQGNVGQAMELGRTAAMIEQQRGRHAEAMDRLRKLALAHPDESQAASLHQAAIANAVEVARNDAAGKLDVYADLLEEHLRRWPDGPTAGQVRWWMGRLRQHQRDWPGAIAAYTAMSPADADHARAVAAAADCHDAWLAAQRAAGEPVGELAGRAAAWLESVVVDGNGRLPQRLDALGQTAVLRAGRFWLDAPPDGYARAEQLLTAGLAAAPDAPAAWTSAVRAALVSALAGQGRRGQADAVLQGISQAGVEATVALVDDLARVARDAPAAVRAELAPLQLHAVGLLGSGLDGLAEPQRRRVGLIHAQALADAGQTDDALRHFQTLAERYPDDASVQQGRARLLASRQDRPALDEALSAWRAIERRTKPGSPAWFEAKYAVAELHYRLGNPKQAERIIALAAITHPELGGPALRARFEHLRRRCLAQ